MLVTWCYGKGRARIGSDRALARGMAFLVVGTRGPPTIPGEIVMRLKAPLLLLVVLVASAGCGTRSISYHNDNRLYGGRVVADERHRCAVGIAALSAEGGGAMQLAASACSLQADCRGTRLLGSMPCPLHLAWVVMSVPDRDHGKFQSSAGDFFRYQARIKSSSSKDERNKAHAEAV